MYVWGRPVWWSIGCSIHDGAYDAASIIQHTIQHPSSSINAAIGKRNPLLGCTPSSYWREVWSYWREGWSSWREVYHSQSASCNLHPTSLHLYLYPFPLYLCLSVCRYSCVWNIRAFALKENKAGAQKHTVHTLRVLLNQCNTLYIDACYLNRHRPVLVG